MNIWVPKIPVKRLPAVLRIPLLGALCAGAYGALHDQVSYSISQEYFTQLKFHQFSYADWGWPPVAFAAEIGFLATWWVGLFAGWALARAGLAELPAPAARTQTLKAFGIVAGGALLLGSTGALLGSVVTQTSELSAWKGVQQNLEIRSLRPFVLVASLHAGSYLGAALGLVCAVVYVRKNRAHASPDRGAEDQAQQTQVGRGQA